MVSDRDSWGGEGWQKELDNLSRAWKKLEQEWADIDSTKEEKPEEKPAEEEKPREKPAEEEKPREKPAEEEKPREKPAKKKSKKEEYADMLKSLKQEVQDIKSVALVTKNGLLIHSNISQGVELQIFSGMSAAMFGAAEATILELKKGPLNDVYAETDDCKIVVMDVGATAIMVALTKSDCNLGFVLMKMKLTAKRAKKLIGA